MSEYSGYVRSDTVSFGGVDRGEKYAESHTQRLVQPSTVNELFNRLGAKPGAVDIHEPAVPKPMQVKCECIVPAIRGPC